MEKLRTDFVDDILNASENTRRKFRVITNDDGTISLEDVTAYSQVGDSFGAAEVNKTNGAVNELNESLTTETINIASGLYLERSGNVCVLHLDGLSASMSAVIPEGYRPIKVSRTIVRYEDGSGYYPALVLINSNGTMGGNFLKDNDAKAFLATGILYGDATWCIN